MSMSHLAILVLHTPAPPLKAAVQFCSSDLFHNYIICKFCIMYVYNQPASYKKDVLLYIAIAYTCTIILELALFYVICMLLYVAAAHIIYHTKQTG